MVFFAMNVAKCTNSSAETKMKSLYSFMYFLSFFSVLSFLFEIYLSVNFSSLLLISPKICVYMSMRE